MRKKIDTQIFSDLDEIVNEFRTKGKKYNIIFAHNGVGKTRLSVSFKDFKKKDGGSGDTLYFNAYTEDLFTWDNDLEENINRFLIINDDSHFFDGMEGADLESKIRPFLHRYVDFDFKILPKDEEYSKQRISFTRIIGELDENGNNKIIENIKISRGEETLFIWCFFLAIAQMAIDGNDRYKWVKYLYIDDPVSSLDDNHAIAIGAHLAQILKSEGNEIKTIISTHHGLFYNVMCNELGSANSFFFKKLVTTDGYSLISMKDTPFFHHVIMAHSLHKAVEIDQLYTYHFNILRNLMEKTAAFYGFSEFGACLTPDKDDADGIIYTRMINIMSHGNYSIFDPTEMQDENKMHFSKLVNRFLGTYKFNNELFNELDKGETYGN